jgi:hypothetical protein
MMQSMLHDALQASQSMQRADADYIAAFRNNMQVMVETKQLSLQQALGFDIDYSAQVFGQEQARLEAIRESDEASVEDRQAAAAMMQEAEARSIAQTSNQYRQLADAARSSADKVAQSYEQAFDHVGSTVQRTFNEILVGQTTWAKGMTRMVQEVETFFLDEVESMAAKWAASGLASLAGGATTTGAAAGGGGFFSWLGGLFSFAGGGIVPSAAGGWALPNFAGATPALLHARAMVLPADISQGLQGMIAGGGAGDAHFHAHFHGPADAPSINRWFRDNLKSSAGAIRDLFRQNALTPRSF